MTTFSTATILGYPRIGADRELKKAVEAFWKGSLTLDQLEEAAADIQRTNNAKLQAKGLTGIPASFSYYDQVLDAIRLFTAVPERFAQSLEADGTLGLEGYFELARGTASTTALELTKWFDTNYHYLVPELSEKTNFRLNTAAIDQQLATAKEQGIELRPQIVGPLTFLLLAKAAEEAGANFEPLSLLDRLKDAYTELLEHLANSGITWVQFDEPALVADQPLDRAELAQLVGATYSKLAEAIRRPAILVTSPFGNLAGNLEPLATSGIEALHLDLVAGNYSQEDLALFSAQDAPDLVAGIINGRNIWRADLRGALTTLQKIQDAGARVTVATSTSLQHVPQDVTRETKLDENLRSWLSFADQKTEEVVTLAQGLAGGEVAIAEQIAAAEQALERRAQHSGTHRQDIRARVDAVTPERFTRPSAAVRQAAQEDLNLPELPTTTIGSFPQTADIRKQRAAFRAGKISEAELQGFLQEEIATVIKLQEEIGLDVLVHGEAERNDMVQYFGENFEGFDTTLHGWVQSYGSRCTRPSILWGDVKRAGEGLRGDAFTVPWTSYAQSLTEKPVKGMLTGPVTILAWSFVRDDQPKGETAQQVALALADEIEDLEKTGTRIIQVDEPALRELLPLREADRADYLDWSVGSFRLATSGVQDSTQIHTHLCYSEFNEIFSSIDDLNADVTSIEAARSRLELLADVPASFDRELGPGVWDIHSPRVPSTEEITELIETAVQYVDRKALWINPDCGLKTRGYEETRASLENLVAATLAVREAAAAQV